MSTGTQVQPVIAPGPQPVLAPVREPAKRTASSRLSAVSLVLLLTAMIASAAFLPGGVNWLVAFASLALLTAVIGVAVTGRPTGVFISERNLMSLSRLQILVWSVVILSGWLTIAVQRIHAGIPDPLAIPMDWHLWALMGISTSSLVGSPLLLSNRTNATVDSTQLEKAATALNEDSRTIAVNADGALYANTGNSDARFADLVQGDEVGNTAYIDPAKLQMLLFTFVLAAAYSYQLFQGMHQAPKDLAMPAVSEGMVALLGISHAGYLGGKTVNYTGTKS